MKPVTDMLRFIDAAPSPYHAVAESVRRLEGAGFTEFDEASPWRDPKGRHFVKRGGSLVAWSGNPMPADEPCRFRIIGAHTDSPNLRIRPNPDIGAESLCQLGIEVYGGVLLNSWLDRNLGLSGRVGVIENSAPTTRLFVDNRPLLRIPQLAIHLDREINQNGLKLNPQMHLQPLWATTATKTTFAEYLAEQLGVDPHDVVSWDVMVHPTSSGTLFGLGEEFVSSARIDNLLSCWAATEALTAAAPADTAVAVTAFFDHEEVGSVSPVGAAGDLLTRVLQRLVGDVEDFPRVLTRSLLLSADGAHATHPNHPERHDPAHRIHLNEGPVLKHNANVRYATDAVGASVFVALCRDLDIPIQHFSSRNDIPCGSTIGPTVAARLGITTIDVGVAQLAMHSAAEMCGAQDPVTFTRALTGFLSLP